MGRKKGLKKEKVGFSIDMIVNESLDRYCNEYLSNFNIIYKQITPINYLDPPILKTTSKIPFEEVLRIKKDN